MTTPPGNRCEGVVSVVMAANNGITDGLLSFLTGIRDSIKGCIYAFEVVFKNSKIRSKVGLSFILNGFLLAFSVLLFEHIVLPCILLISDWTLGLFGKTLSQENHNSLESIVSYIFTGLWMLPMFVVCTPINSIWFREIALEANEHLKISTNKSSKWTVKVMITDLLYGMAVEVVFTIQATLVNFLPVCGQFLSLIHMSLLYSLYSFEYKWFYQGISVQKRLSNIELKWPYFLGFGLVLSLLTSVPYLLPFNQGVRHAFGNVVLCSCVFALAFPLMIVSSFKTNISNINYYQIPVFKLSRLICNKMFSILLSSK